MTLYELTDSYRALVEAYYGAETDDEAAALLTEIEACSEDIEAKADAYARMIRNTEGEVDALKKEEKRLNGMRKRREALIERLKGNMFAAMELLKVKSIETSCGKWGVQNNPWSCTVVNEDSVPERFKSYRTECDIDKKAIIAEFKATGEEFDGCVIEQKRGVRFK